MHRARVLLVEDNEDNRIVFATVLRHYGFDVLEAGDGREGLRLALQERPDVVLMDISIPYIDGWEVTRLIKGNSQTSHIPVIAVTAHSLSEDRERAAAIGFDGFLAKPCRPAQLVQEVRRFFEPAPVR